MKMAEKNLFDIVADYIGYDLDRADEVIRSVKSDMMNTVLIIMGGLLVAVGVVATSYMIGDMADGVQDVEGYAGAIIGVAAVALGALLGVISVYSTIYAVATRKRAEGMDYWEYEGEIDYGKGEDDV